jgi:hypothetical protein
MGCGSHQRESASVRGNIPVNGWVKGCQGLKCSGRVSNFGEMQVLYNSSQCLKIRIRRDELAEVCLDGEVSQTCPPDFAE